MMKASRSEYWKRRFEALKDEGMTRAELTDEELRKLCEEAARDMEKEVIAWYERYAKDNKMTLSQARKILDAKELKAFRMTLQEYIRLAEKEKLSDKYMKMLERASIRARLDRSQAIYIQLANVVEKLAKKRELRLSSLLEETYKSTYYQSAYETQKATSFTVMPALDEQGIQQIIHGAWARDGKDFSRRIWEDRDRLVNHLQTELTRGLMTQKGSLTIANRMAKSFNASHFHARRLVETETAYIQERAMLDSFGDMGIEKMEILGVLDTRTSDICREMDGKKVDRKDAKPGITTPPFHCYCRSTVVPVIKEDEEDTRAARDPTTGKTVFVPAEIKYPEWYSKYIEPATKPTGIGHWNFDKQRRIIPTKVIPKETRYSPKLKAEPNAVIKYWSGSKGKRQVNLILYDENGFVAKRLHYGNHGNPKLHNFGTQEDPDYLHVHNIIWMDGKATAEEGVAMSNEERRYI